MGKLKSIQELENSFAASEQELKETPKVSKEKSKFELGFKTQNLQNGASNVSNVKYKSIE
jgi:hypothetical protein